jgi:hypothetical protein
VKKEMGKGMVCEGEEWMEKGVREGRKKGGKRGGGGVCVGNSARP